MNYFIVAADRIVDGEGDHLATEKVLKKAEKFGLKTIVLHIVTLAQRWEDNLPPGHFKSGASAMAAINRAQTLLATDSACVVLIRGTDLLRTGYERKDRDRFMKLYRGKFTPLDGYTRLVPAFLKYHGISLKQFNEISHSLFENYLRTWRLQDPKRTAPNARWFEPVTRYFRGVDCANPNIDFSGQLVVMDEARADLLRIPSRERIRILGNSFSKLAVDGFESIPKVAPYLHLKKTIRAALDEARIDFKEEFLQGRALLEAYTCYPVVPMGLLLRLGLVRKLSELPEFLKTHEVTITGGLNLARAPWNLTSLNYLIAMREKLKNSRRHRYGLVHGNGSLGNQQGITILGK
ncbi:MAG TPA: hypothetical protein VNJ01_18210 [Bacteriovoracaceae bacterium]|nr:hypothetical protein [Bacteriovoracaceae bacterium]